MCFGRDIEEYKYMNRDNKTEQNKKKDHCTGLFYYVYCGGLIIK